jgi:type IV fimbrial biogenesis protein FimT
VEALIGMVILGLLVALAVPGFQEWIRNSQIRNAADAMNNGLQVARAEAISRNGLVQFRFNATTFGWEVWDLAGNVQIRAWTPQQGARNTTVTATGGNMVTFNGLGRVVANTNVVPPATVPAATLTTLDVAASAGSTSATRALRVTIGPAGNARMCDPAVTITGDPRGC